MSHCPYCAAAVSPSAGEVFCSRHMTDFDRLDNGIFYVRGSDIHSESHFSRFALRFMLSGQQDFTLDKKKYSINSSGILVFNQHSVYTLDTGARPASHIGIAFRPSFLNDAALTLSLDDARLLDLPDTKAEMPVSEFRLWPLTSRAHKFRNRLLHYVAPGTTAPGNVDAIAFEVMQWYIEEYNRYGNLLHRFTGNTSVATKTELLRRADMARELIEYSDPESLDVRSIAQKTGFSEYHFIRTYKAIFGKSPYQHIISRKLQKAYTMLNDTQLSISDIAHLTGYHNHPAFSRAFKSFFGRTPNQVRIN